MFARLRLRVKRILMIPADWVNSFLQQATKTGSRSTVLRPLAWFIGICVTATIGAGEARASGWIIALFAIFAGLGMLLYLGAYVYCLLGNKEDLLRSEKYSIQKLAIEKGFFGDSTSGIFTIEPTTGIVPYSQPTASAKEEMK
jgi:hypothetical protein